MTVEADSLLEVDGLQLQVTSSEHRPVDDVSFVVNRGEIFGIVGESGSGKTLTTRAILQLLPRGVQIRNGSVKLGGRELIGLSEAQLRELRGAHMALIPQSAGSSLNPLVTVWRQVAAPMRAHGERRRDRLSKVVELLEQLGLDRPEQVARSYPHQLSGGMQQRVVVAASLAARPQLLLADEPTTALDPIVRVQFADLLKDVRARRGTSIILVTHDLGVIARLCDRVAVMYGGRVMEQGRVRDVLASPRHPYTQGLLDATPDLARLEPTVPIPGRPPLGTVVGNTCPFTPRCAAAFDRCSAEAPPAFEVGAEHLSRCWLHLEKTRDQSLAGVVDEAQ
jgi:oligopeptide/dipeptide ABC transporter ATP-binding protein